MQAPLLLGLAAAAGVAYLGLTDPYRTGSHWACPFLALTGLLCAGCGGQRAVHELARGDLAAAWDVNPLVVLGAPVAAVALLAWLRRRWRDEPARAGGLARAVTPWLFAAVVLGFTALRNVPGLAPWLGP